MPVVGASCSSVRPDPRAKSSSNRRPLIFEPRCSLTAAADFLKLKAPMIDFDDAVAAQDNVTFCGDVNCVPIGQKRAG